MGQSASSLLLCRRPTQLRILTLGLDAAGKTTLLYRLKMGELVTTIPSIGFNVETFRFDDKATLTMWDIGGRCKMRALYQHYIDGTQGVIYVIDSTDRERLSESLDEIKHIAELLTSHQMSQVPLIVLCNKCDSPSSAAAETQEAVQTFLENCPDLRGRPHNCLAVSAARGDGLTEALNWLVAAALNQDAGGVMDVHVALKQDGKREVATKTATGMSWSGLYRMVKSVAMR